MKLNIRCDICTENTILDFQKYILGHIDYPMWNGSLKKIKTKTVAFRNKIMFIRIGTI